MSTVRVSLPGHLRNLARLDVEVTVEVPPGSDPEARPTIRDLLQAVERAHPELRGTVRDPATGGRRDFLRLYAGGRDLSLEPPEAPLPDDVLSGEEAFMVVGAVAGG